MKSMKLAPIRGTSVAPVLMKKLKNIRIKYLLIRGIGQNIAFGNSGCGAK